MQQISTEEFGAGGYSLVPTLSRTCILRPYLAITENASQGKRHRRDAVLDMTLLAMAITARMESEGSRHM